MLKNKKIILTIILLTTIVSTGSIVNASILNETPTVKTVVLDTIKENDYTNSKSKEVTTKEFYNVVGEVENEQNLLIIKDLMNKSKNYLGNSFYIEIKLSCEGGIGGNGIVKQYWQDYNYRSEEFDTNGNLLYVTVYNKDDDTSYKYDVRNNKLDKTTKYCEKYYLANDRTKYSFLWLDSAQLGALQTIDYNGKKAVYSKNISKEVDTQIWYDDETGMILDFKQKCFDPDGKIEVSTSDSYIVKPNQNFDNSIFKYDDNHKSIGNIDLK